MIMTADEFTRHMAHLFLNVTEAAELFGVNRRTIHVWMTKGCTNKSTAMLLRIAAGIGWNADDIKQLSAPTPGWV